MSSVNGVAVEVPTADGVADAYLASPDDGLGYPGVLMLMDGIGLRPQLESMARRIASHGYTVLLPNLFYRSGRAPLVPLPEFIDMSTTTIFSEIGQLIRSFTAEQAVRDAGYYLDWLAASPLTIGDRVGVTGYCMGGRNALLIAAHYPDRIAAAAGFHSGQLAPDAPDSPHLLAGKITAELYFGHADEDPSLPPEQIERLNTALTEAGVTFRADVYPGAGHGYTQADTSRYHPEGDARHWQELLALFDRNL
ncbi:dienelactone hydrolase family protein [Nocardia jejuensis]|uniref:dienelactone hydrolase family protein n=1 Tax=Nocardia jejuensis TaxID=328049 RepID=UPI000830E866|nr:dienelactone hydrolase family protein [Nocardia jejuensis]